MIPSYEDLLNRFLDDRQLDNQDQHQKNRLEELAERLDLTVDDLEKLLDDFQKNVRLGHQPAAHHLANSRDRRSGKTS